MNRRTALQVIALVPVGFVQQHDTGLFAQGSLRDFTVDLSNVKSILVKLDGETVSFKPDEIFAALKTGKKA